MKILLTIIISFTIFLTSSAHNVTSVDLTKSKFKETNAEEIFKDVKIIPLETHKDGLLEKHCTYYLTDKYIIAVGFLQRAYMFDRETGAFIREVSSLGQGPDEYTGFIYHKCGFDEKNGILFASIGAYTSKWWRCINIETNKMESNLKKPLSENSSEFLSVCAPWFIKNDTYASFCSNRTGKDKVRLVVYRKDGTVIKKYPNYLEYEKHMNSFSIENGIFYYYNNLTYFKEPDFNDTVFCVNEKKMTPHLVFKLGDKQPSYYHQEVSGYNKGKYFINFVYESNLYVLFNFSYLKKGAESSVKSARFPYCGYYDKKSKQVYISSIPDYKTRGYIITGIPLRFFPVSINKNKEMIAYIDPEELIKYKNQLSPKYKQLFKDIQEDDNPIVIIAKLKD